MTQNAKNKTKNIYKIQKREMEMSAFCVISILELFLKKSQDYLVKVSQFGQQKPIKSPDLCQLFY